jgi:quinoprotein glucose dehydrogenase
MGFRYGGSSNTFLNKKNGIKIPVVIAVSKTGNTILVNRLNGKSIYGFDYEVTPNSDIPGEPTSEKQILIKKPDPFSNIYFNFKNDITNLSNTKRDYVLHKLRNARSHKFLPTSLNYDVIMFGLNGGAQWPGAALDKKSNSVIIPSNNIAYLLRGKYISNDPEKIKKIAAKNNTYSKKCLSCHSNDLSGQEKSNGEDKFNPSLIGITRKRNKDYLTSVEIFRYNHKYAYINNSKIDVSLIKKITKNDLILVTSLFSEIDKNKFTYSGSYQNLLDQDGQWGNKPPWGFISSINLNNGELNWKVPFGNVYDKKTKKTYQGDSNFGGVIVTGAGIIFATGTRDQKARAFDVDTGDLLWESQLPASGSSYPMTFEYGNCQYVLFTATGGFRYKNYSDSTVAFKLPNCKT